MTNAAEKLIVQTVGLTKIFRDFWGHARVVAVDSLDLEIYPRQVFGLLGPNGSGKSTTIKMLLGLLFPTRGWARVLGQHPGNVKTNARIGFLPEESYLYPFLNARETLDFYGRLFSLTYQQRRQRIESLLEMVGLAGVSRRPIGEFSKGMTRRIGLAQALINDPDLLVLDEPTAGLDPIGTRQIKDLITHLAQRGKTVLLCSHLLADVEDVCDRVCILYGGKVQDRGGVNELLARTDMTQIRTSQLSNECLTEIKNVIHTYNSDCEIEIQTPRDRLEDYFLRIVSQAQAAEVETSGAVMGSGVSDFLGDSSGRPEPSEFVIDKLVVGREQATEITVPADSAQPLETTQPTSALPVSPKDAVRHDVIDSLVDGKTTSPETPAAEPASSQRSTFPVKPIESTDNVSDNTDLDRSVIDRLTNNPQDQTPGELSQDSNGNDQEDPQ